MSDFNLLKDVHDIKLHMSSSENQAGLTKIAIEKTSEFLHQYNSFLDEDGLEADLIKWEAVEFRLNNQLDNIKFRNIKLNIKQAWEDINTVLDYWADIIRS